MLNSEAVACLAQTRESPTPTVISVTCVCRFGSTLYLHSFSDKNLVQYSSDLVEVWPVIRILRPAILHKISELRKILNKSSDGGTKRREFFTGDPFDYICQKANNLFIFLLGVWPFSSLLVLIEIVRMTMRQFHIPVIKETIQCDHSSRWNGSDQYFNLVLFVS